VIVLPVDDALTAPVPVVSVPEPSPERTVMLGEELRFARLPAAVDFACACQVCAPADEGAVAPGAPPPVAPYVLANVWPAARVRDETVIVPLATLSVPALEVA